MGRRALAIAGLISGLTIYAGAQQSGMGDMQGMNQPAQTSQQSTSKESGMPAGMAMPGMAMQMGGNASAAMMLRQSSGTDVQPQAWAMPQAMRSVGDWQLMWMGQAFLVDVQQTGPPAGRSTPDATGLDKLYSTNWGMLAAVHPLGRGAVMLRAMLSLEPATVSDRRYPELFQTGETAYGAPIVDGQHPHNFVMELAAELAEPLGAHARGYIYYGLVGDPALGPPAYPHRASAAELPQAPLGHHWEDSTHIADNVATVGVEDRWLRLEASGFYGQEPGENRWTITTGAMDSWATRLVLAPWQSVTAQISTGRLTHPEAASPGDIERTTASVEQARGAWAWSAIWGRDYKTDGHYGVNAVTAEFVAPWRQKNLFTGRYEWSQRDELLDADPALKQNITAETGERWFDVNAYTAGYTRVLGNFHGAELGAGANLTLYGVPQTLTPYYGQHPVGVSMYLRVRLKGKPMDCC
jgi:hypothetical protein